VIARDAPVFAEPWEARIFAIVVALAEAGRFPWAEFQTRLAAAIAADPERPYWSSWLTAALSLLEEGGLATRAELEGVVRTLRVG
jgi:nitrile hydratase accessory protein